MSEESTWELIIGFIIGFIVATVLICVTIETSHKTKKEAINLGYAKMVLERPTDSRAKFEWIKRENLIRKEK